MSKSKKVRPKPPSIEIITNGKPAKKPLTRKLNRANVDNVREDMFRELIELFGSSTYDPLDDGRHPSEHPSDEELEIGLLLALNDITGYHLDKIADGSILVSQGGLSFLSPLKKLTDQISKLLPAGELRTFRLE